MSAVHIISRRPESEAFKLERSRSGNKYQTFFSVRCNEAGQTPKGAPVDPRLICFKLEAPLHQRDVCICIKMNTPQLVLEIRQLSGVPIALQIWGLEQTQPPEMFHELGVATEVDERAALDLDGRRIILEQGV